MLTLAAAVAYGAKHWVLWLPESGSSAGVESAGHVDVTLAAAAAPDKDVFAEQALVLAVQGPRESAGLPRSWRNGG